MTVELAAAWEERVMRSAHPVAYRALKAAKRPVVRVPGLGVLVTEASILRSVLMDTEHFSKKGRGASSELWTPVLGPSLLINMDGTDHLALRRKIGPLFAPAHVAALATASLGAPVARLTERLAAGERVDIVSEVRHYASATVGQLVGLPEHALTDDLFQRVSSITGFVSLAKPRFTPSEVVAAKSILAELTDAARDSYRQGAEDTVPGRMRELGLTEDEAVGAVGAFVIAGTETLVSYLPRLVAILVDSGWFARIAADRSQVESAIAEGLRVTTPSPVMLRSVVSDTRIGSVRVRRGDRVILATFAANRALGEFDPGVNSAAALKQLWFGAGAHFCIGAPLAMAQIRLVVDALLGVDDVRIVSRETSRGVMIPSYSRLEIERT